MCGEQKSMLRWALALLGSPPRVRGTGGSGSKRAKGAGITPACAGNSLGSTIVALGNKDHPRVCGEQDMIAALDSQLEGSPPRVRGTGRYSRGGDYFMRITPACAGNSSYAIHD